MGQVSFYHLTRTSIERALPRLLEKVLQKNERALVICAPEQLRLLDDGLWTYRPDGFLPHGTGADGRPLDHPVWITSHWQDVSDNINRSQYLVITNGGFPEGLHPMDHCFYFFHGTDSGELLLARALWRRLKNEGHHTLIYWKQDEAGAWIKEGNQ